MAFSRPQLVSLVCVSVSMPFQMAVVWPHLFPAFIALLPLMVRIRLAVCVTFITLLLLPLIRLCAPVLRPKVKLSYQIKFLGWKVALPLVALLALYQCAALVAPFAQRKSDVEEAYLWQAVGFGHELDRLYECGEFLAGRMLLGSLLALQGLMSLSACGAILWRRNDPVFVWTVVAVVGLSALLVSPLAVMLEHRLISVSFCGEPSLLARGAWYGPNLWFVIVALLLAAIQLPSALFGFTFHRFPAVARAQASNLRGLGVSILAAVLFLASVALLCLRGSLSPLSMDRARRWESQFRCHLVNSEHDEVRVPGSGGDGPMAMHHELASSFIVPLIIQGTLLYYIMKCLTAEILTAYAGDPVCCKSLDAQESSLCLMLRSPTTRVIAACFVVSCCGWWCIDMALRSATRYSDTQCATLAVAPLGWFFLTIFLCSIFVLSVAEAVLVVHEDDLTVASESLIAKAEV